MKKEIYRIYWIFCRPKDTSLKWVYVGHITIYKENWNWQPTPGSTFVSNGKEYTTIDISYENLNSNNIPIYKLLVYEKDKSSNSRK